MPLIDAKEIRNAVEMLDAADDKNWTKSGKPNIAVVRQLMSNDEVDASDIDRAMGEKFERPAVTANKEVGAAPGSGGGGAPATLSAEARASAKLDGPDENTQRGALETTSSAVVESAHAKLQEITPVLTSLEVQRRNLDEAIELKRREADAQREVIEQNTVHLNDAEMVKVIQRQTQARLMKQAEDNKKINAILSGSGIKTFASPLDAAMANGGRRSTVLVNGKPVVAPHPRSAEGIKNYASWVHSGAKLAQGGTN